MHRVRSAAHILVVDRTAVAARKGDRTAPRCPQGFQAEQKAPVDPDLLTVLAPGFSDYKVRTEVRQLQQSRLGQGTGIAVYVEQLVRSRIGPLEGLDCDQRGHIQDAVDALGVEVVVRKPTLYVVKVHCAPFVRISLRRVCG